MADGKSLRPLEVSQMSHKQRIIPSRSHSSRKASPERYASPVRHRPLSPNKLAVVDALPDDRSSLLLALAAKERALSELRERKRELEAQISLAEQDVATAKKQLSSSNSPLKCLNSQSGPRDIIQKDRELETLQHLADGVSAIWKDVVQATIGEQATT